MATNVRNILSNDAGATEPRVEPAQASSEYSSPRLVPLGPVSELIQGYWNEGWADYGKGYKHN
jgi:hypothetical protein